MSEGPGVAASAQEIQQALRELRQEPYGKARSARTEELAEAAERLGDDEALVAALLDLLSAYEYGDEIRKAPVLFNRILGLYRDKPESFDDRGVHSLFWCFKWITTSLISTPEIPLATIQGWIGLMREHYAAAGKPMQAVHTSRYNLAAHTGIDRDIAYELWATRPRDEFSDCEACEARNRGSYWLDQGDDARALREWQPVLEGKLGCSEEPAATISRALLPLVREGRLEEAASFHRIGYRATRGKVSMDAEVSRHLEFLALTGNTARGLELLAENRGRFDSDTDADNRLTFLDGVRVLLNRVVAADPGTPVPGPGGRTCPAAELLAQLCAQTDDLARRFDERNGTTWQSDIHRARCSRQPLTREPLPLGVRVAPEPSPVAGPVAPATASTPVAAPATARPPLPEDFATLLAQARAALTDGRPESGRLWDAVAQRVTDADLDDLLRAELVDRRAFKLIEKGQWADAEALLRDAVAGFEKAGEPGRSVSRRSRAAWCAFMAAQDPAAAPWDEFDALLTATGELDASGAITPTDYTIVLHSRAAAAMQAVAAAETRTTTGDAGGQSTVAVANSVARQRAEREIRAFREAALRLAVPSRAAVAESMAAALLTAQGLLDAAADRVEAAVKLTEEAKRPWDLARFLAQRGHLLNRLGRFDEAATSLHHALVMLAEWPDTDVDDAAVLRELAHNRLHVGDTTAAIGHLTAAAARFDRRGADLAAAGTRATLGQALLRAGRRADAVAVFESLLVEPGEAQLDQRERAQIRLDLGTALMALDEPRQAAEVLAGLAEFVAPWPDRAVHTLVACELGTALFAARMWEQAGTAVERAVASHAEAPNPAALCAMLRSGAEAEYRYRGADGVERALELLRRADEVNLAAKEIEGRYRRWPETALNADMRAQALGSVHRDEEALAAAREAIGAWRLGGDQAIGSVAESARVAAILEGVRLGRRRQAADRLRPVIAECQDAGHEQAVRVLSRLLADLQADLQAEGQGQGQGAA